MHSFHLKSLIGRLRILSVFEQVAAVIFLVIRAFLMNTLEDWFELVWTSSGGILLL